MGLVIVLNPRTLRRNHSRSWGAAGKGGKRAGRRTVHSSTDKPRPRSILQSSGVRPSRRAGFAGLQRRPARGAREDEWVLTED